MKNEKRQLDKHIYASRDRQRHIDAVVNSNAHKKVVVSGPGTGKTYLFKEILKTKTNSLTLSFVNALVEDIALQLYGISDVKTLHSFARGVISKALSGDVKIFPKLSAIINRDAGILLGKKVDFDVIFHNRNDENELIEFYRSRKEYYDKFYGYSDIVFAAVKHLERARHKIPVFEQVVVDEFQDFNKLEVSLIDLLAEKSPVLLAGDDDQALYEFKSADAEFLRSRFRETDAEYASFDLPYCSRCTQVIVDAVNDVIRAATANGQLKNRIKKRFSYFDDEQKDIESAQNPMLCFSQVHERQIPWFIDKHLNEIAQMEKDRFSVLVITPTNQKSNSVIDGLRRRGFQNVENVRKKESNEPEIIDGFRILLDDSKSNLGWRIVSEAFLDKTEFTAVLTETARDDPKRVSDVLDANIRKKVRAVLAGLRKVKKGEDCDSEILAQLMKFAGVIPADITKNILKSKIDAPSYLNPAVRKIPIKTATIQRSKGLAEDYVFITHFDDRFFIKAKDKTEISDLDVCKFVVALTRARRKVFLVSTGRTEGKDPMFLKWINEDRIERL